ncbi:uncharacterized protein PS065_008134 [Dugong dugon]
MEPRAHLGVKVRPRKGECWQSGSGRGLGVRRVRRERGHNTSRHSSGRGESEGGELAGTLLPTPTSFRAGGREQGRGLARGCPRGTQSTDQATLRPHALPEFPPRLSRGSCGTLRPVRVHAAVPRYAGKSETRGARAALGSPSFPPEVFYSDHMACEETIIMMTNGICRGIQENFKGAGPLLLKGVGFPHLEKDPITRLE